MRCSARKSAWTTGESQTYSGITRHAGKWLVKLRYRGKDVTIGHYEDLEDAAWVADFVRYMFFGLNPAYWHYNVAKPNFPPRDSGSILRVEIISRLVSAAVVPVEALRRHLEEYDAVVVG